MITFNYETSFKLSDSSQFQEWIIKVISLESFECSEINYVFCDDDYLHRINMEYLKHDTLTDIISFDYTIGNIISGDIYISIPRVEENALLYKTTFQDELSRVMIHGILHYCGYKDKSDKDKVLMRDKEDYYLKMLNN